MTGKTKTGVSFPGLCRYVFRRDKNSAVLFAEGVRNDSAAHMSQDFDYQRSLRPSLGKAVLHVALALHPDDANGRTPEQISRLLTEIGRAYAREMGLTNTQHSLVQHTDRLHPHAHLLVNRVDNDGQPISDQFIGQRSRAVCQKLEQQFELTGAEQKGREEAREAGPTRQQERAKTPREKREADWQRARHEVGNALKHAAPYSGNWKELEAQLTRHGVQLHLSTHLKKDGTQTPGVLFEKDGHRFKGSEVARDYSAGKLLQTFAQYQAQIPALTQQADQAADAFYADALSHLFQEQARQAKTPIPEQARQASRVFQQPSPSLLQGGEDIEM